MSGVNETRFLVQQVCNSNQKLNHDECCFERKKLDYRVSREKDSMWNPSICVCECNKAFITDEYFDIKNCSCEKCLIGKLLLTCNLSWW